MHVASHITYLLAMSIDEWIDDIRPYREYFSHTGRFKDDIMKAGYS